MTVIFEDGKDYLRIYEKTYGFGNDEGIFGNGYYSEDIHTKPKNVYIGRNFGYKFKDEVTIQYLDLNVEDIELLAIGNEVVFVSLGIGSNENKLKSIYSHNNIPPYFEAPNSVYLNTQVYVPLGTKDAYNVDSSWKPFFLIDEMDINKMWKGEGEQLNIRNKFYVMSKESEHFSLEGKKIFIPQKGINIIKMDNGITKKVLVK